MVPNLSSSAKMTSPLYPPKTTCNETWDENTINHCGLMFSFLLLIPGNCC
jgi:hypothetical protein